MKTAFHQSRLGEGATDIKITLEGGSSGGTETATITGWDYRFWDNAFSTLDNTWSSSTTTHSGKDQEGHPSLSQTTLEIWASDFYEQSSVTSPWFETGTEEDRDTHTIQQGGYILQSASISGPEDKRKHTLAIDSAFALFDETDDAVIVDYEGPSGNDYAWGHHEEHDISVHERSDTSSYRSSHTAGENGLARDGSFRRVVAEDLPEFVFSWLASNRKKEDQEF